MPVGKVFALGGFIGALSWCVLKQLPLNQVGDRSQLRNLLSARVFYGLVALGKCLGWKSCSKTALSVGRTMTETLHINISATLNL